MARVLFVVPPLTGHVNPTVAVGRALAARGHEVAWAGLPGVVDTAVPDGCGFLPVGASAGAEWYEGKLQDRGNARGAAALKFLWEEFIVPVARLMLDDLVDVVETFGPGVMIVDQQAPAGALVARRAGVAWVTSATTPAELVDPLRGLPKVDEWIRAQLHQLEVEFGDEGRPGSDLRFSDLLTLAFTTVELSGPPVASGPVAFVGASITDRPPDPDFDWSILDPELPHVLVSLGTVNAELGGRFFGEIVEALAGAALQVFVVAPHGLVDLPDRATNITVFEHVPQLELMGHLDVVVCHGGHNTVCEALFHGVPLLVAPIRDDQPFVADQVVRSGAGIRVKFSRVRAAELGDAVRALLAEDRYRTAAEGIGDSFRRAGGATAAADHIEALVATAASDPHQQEESDHA